MKYKLQKYSGMASRHECPRCGRQHCFTLYIDENDVPVHESVGRCDHESSCGYNYTPWQYYQDHPPFERVIPEIKVVKPAYRPQPSYIPYSFIDKSVRLDRESDFIRFLLTILDPLIVEGLVVDYKLGVTKSGDVIFFQIDRFGRCRTGKVMKYNPETGHRIKDEAVKGRITWIHSLLKQTGRLSANWSLKQCLFGEHLLPLFPDKTVALVESEKTAVICAGMMPEYVWLATGGKSQLNERLNVLRGRKVVAFPDVDGYAEWRTKLSAMAGLDVTVSDYLERVATPEDRENHVDIADLLIRDNKEPARDSQSQTFLAIREFISPEYHDELKQLIDELDLELVGVTQL